MSRTADVQTATAAYPPAASDLSDAVDPVVRFEAVGLRYGRGAEVLRDVSFDLPRGSLHFLTGASGAGKTSLLSLIHLSRRPTRGVVRLFGQDLATAADAALPALRRRIGVVFQDMRLLDHLSVFDNAALPLRIAGARPDAYAADVDELLAWVGLGERAAALPAALSGGEKQRLAIARAVVARPDILLADEPTGNVDAEMGRRILRLFVELNRLGTTVLIATHDQDLVARAGMPVLHLEAGRLTAPPQAPIPPAAFEAQA